MSPWEGGTSVSRPKHALLLTCGDFQSELPTPSTMPTRPYKDRTHRYKLFGPQRITDLRSVYDGAHKSVLSAADLRQIIGRGLIDFIDPIAI